MVDSLKEKHPPAEPIQPESVMQGPLRSNVDSIHFAAIDEQMILKAAMQTKGSSVPSHVDSDQFRRIFAVAISKQKARSSENS